MSGHYLKDAGYSLRATEKIGKVLRNEIREEISGSLEIASEVTFKQSRHLVAATRVAGLTLAL